MAPGYLVRTRAATAKPARLTANAAPAWTGSGSAAPASRATVPTIRAPTITGAAQRVSVGSPRAAWPAGTYAPIHAANVPSIHHRGSHHQLLPPPTASQVQG